ncbi:PQQ-like beta-propeller repeat protein [Sulfitobacter sabulilitoris]|uniref:Quinoprotein n=1 Tax=Sulfitobacter sabulilitoris TaxID=2562655 RepID=A0A5S3PP15_9RHOB|nr:PQQ-like beta-propeller repeat protein [Sulfitobacter sabulilitoris]TMM54255.1 quinoprotein [Sulfitobacter sabulilitoris]
MTAISNIPATRRPGRAILATLAISALLAACAEPEVILPGKRENIRSVLQDPGLEPIESGPVANVSRAISLPAATSNASWPQAIGTPRTRTAHPALGAALAPLWSSSIGAGDSRRQRITADPVVAGGLIYTLDAGSTVTATDIGGRTVWQNDIRPVRDGEGQATGGGIAVSGGVLYVSLGYGSLVALDAATGTVTWRQQLDATGSGAPTVYDGIVYLTAGDDTGWAVNTANGRILWQISAATNINNVLGAPAPALSDDLAIFGFGSGELQAVFRRGGLRRWDAAVLGERPGRALSKVGDVTGAPVIVGDTVYAGNQSGRIVALDTGSGARIWTAPEGAIGRVWPAGDSVFAITDTNELVRLDARDGSRVWGVPLPNFVKDRPRKRSEVFANHGPVIAGGRVIVASSDGQLRSFDPRDGRLIASTPVPGGATTAPVVAGGVLYVVSTGGKLHAFR